MVQSVNVTIGNKDYHLDVQSERYNGRTIYYLLNEHISQLFDHAVPDNLVLMEEGDGFVSSPRLSEMQGGYIVQQIWQEIKKSTGNS
ncbi:MAG: hypothetical protein J7623_16500 [Chitinophaga sp.]|uniref:hypothetical protein n=1 Tax=Chitinophaga sp. TaxID=1869181 RepID=UPI001B1B456B|nr:hypothetical protein [Chitinophaga sp.]MBO9730242.1 hypothetical protein [Chitinophaga sp.]